jgi:hypothetical protein
MGDITTAVKAAAEANRTARLKRESMGIYKATFMRMTLTEDAYSATKNMDNATFRRFVSKAIRDYAKARQTDAA